MKNLWKFRDDWQESNYTSKKNQEGYGKQFLKSCCKEKEDPKKGGYEGLYVEKDGDNRRAM